MAAAITGAGSGIGRALAIPATRTTGTIKDVRHIVILMQENRSFDHYFGTMKGVRGFVWVFGVLGILPTLLAVVSVLSGKGLVSWPMTLIASAPTLLLVGLLWARRAQPVIGLSRDGDDLRLRFADPHYGVAFERANRRP